MDTVTYPQQAVGDEVSRLTVPVRINVKQRRDDARRFGVAWTPQFFILRPRAQVPARMWQGWLAPASFVAELKLGVAYAHLQDRSPDRAMRLCAEIVSSDADFDRRGEARYWQAVAHSKLHQGAGPLELGYAVVRSEFADTPAGRKLSYPRT